MFDHDDCLGWAMRVAFPLNSRVEKSDQEKGAS